MLLVIAYKPKTNTQREKKRRQFRVLLRAIATTTHKYTHTHTKAAPQNVYDSIFCLDRHFGACCCCWCCFLFFLCCFALSAVGTFLWSTRKPKARTDRQTDGRIDGTIIHGANDDDALKQANQSSLRTQKWEKQ